VAEFFHAYYIIMLAPPLGAVIGVAAALLWQKRESWLVHLEESPSVVWRRKQHDRGSLPMIAHHHALDTVERLDAARLE